MSRPRRGRRRLAAVAAHTAAVLLTVPACAGGADPADGVHRAGVTVGTGQPMPALDRPALVPGPVDPSRLRGAAALVTFVDSGPTSAGQLPALRSMRTQYGRQGLRLVVVLRATDHDAAVNAAYDLGAGDVATVADDDDLERRFGVRQRPTTLLADRDGVVRARWEGVVLPAPLAAAVAQVVRP